MNRSERINYRGDYRVIRFDNRYSESGEEIAVYNPQDVQFIVDDVREVFSLYPEENYDFSLLLAADDDNDEHNVVNDDLLPELNSIEQLSEKIAQSTTMKRSSLLMTSTTTMGASSGTKIKKLSLNLVVKPWNFIFIPVVLCTANQFPKTKFVMCPTAEDDMNMRKVVVAIDITACFSDITKRILYKFLLLWQYPIEDINFSEFVLSLYQEDGSQHIDSSTLIHNELVVLKMKTFDDKLLNHIRLSRQVAEFTPASQSDVIPLAPQNFTVERAASVQNSDDPILNQLTTFLAGSGIDISMETILAVRGQGGTAEEMMRNLMMIYDQSQPSSSSSPVPSATHTLDLYNFQIPPEICKRECKICMELFPMEDMYILNCNQSHAFCLNCLSQQIHVSITPSIDSAGFIPACPCANLSSGCRYTLTLKEIEQILNLSVDQNLIPTNTRNDDLKKANKMFFIAGCISAGHICCPNCPSSGDDCGVWFDAPRSSLAQGACVECPQCKQSFCCKCRASPYHYKCGCREVVAYERFWLEWNTNGKQQYQQELSVRDAQYKETLERARADHEQKVVEARRRFEATVENEREMARRYKMCPRCSVPIEHISGCDSMVCGRDYHGNPIGNGLGCGNSFYWSSAPAYAPKTGNEPVPAEIELVEPEKAKDVEHLIMEGVPITCDNCHNQIVGPLIRCVNCPSFDICFKCSSTVDFGNDHHSHNNTHICTVIFENN